MTTAVKEDLPSVKRLAGFLNGHLSPYVFQREWPGLVLGESGLARMGSVMGWVLALSQAGESALAERVAAGLTDKLDYLSDYGGEVDGARFPMRAYRVTLHDDGTFNNFSLAWYRYTPVDKLGTDMKNKIQVMGEFYVFCHCGGLIYHGPGHGQSFTVSLTDDMWGVHT